MTNYEANQEIIFNGEKALFVDYSRRPGGNHCFIFVNGRTLQVSLDDISLKTNERYTAYLDSLTDNEVAANWGFMAFISGMKKAYFTSKGINVGGQEYNHSILNHSEFTAFISAKVAQ